MRHLNLLLFLFLVPAVVCGQSIVVEPYLQDASPTSMTIMWETDSNDETFVDWGLTSALGTSTAGTAVASSGTARVHTVTLTGLSAATTYYYQVRTGTAISSKTHFITPANASAEASFNLAAMSDMQQDGGNPNKFSEVVTNGLIKYIQDSLGSDLPSNLGMVVIPGDLVPNGNNYLQWQNTFFGPAEPLFSQIPVYPVPGNHENNSAHFFRYFHLPLNGSVGYKEHWWFKDHSNVRLIGLDSNPGYRLAVQLTWLDSVLDDACSNADIDFIFVQLHHPHKSELWLPGELDYTGDVISRLDTFSTDCNKPSIHFFGHTHGYSRGQSRDHSHLWVNVATAGGHIDYWGAYPQADYDEFTISQDEYGFVFVEIQAGSDPQFALKRFSIGDETTTKDNTLEDLIRVRKNNNGPTQPVGLFPTATDTVLPDCFMLESGTYADVDGDLHGASHWQVSSSCADWTSPVFEKWTQFENWYFEVNTQANDDLLDEQVTDLVENTDYCWRVRYRDRSLAWSSWSTPIMFHTDATLLTANLLQNPDAENGIANWTVDAGAFESLTDGQCGGTSPHSGTNYFAAGAVCTDGAFGAAHQDVDISAYSVAIDAGGIEARYGGYLRDWAGGDDVPAVAMQFLDAGSTVLSSTDTTSIAIGAWTLVNESTTIPSGARTARYIVTGTRNAGADNDSYFDDLFLKLSLFGDSCQDSNGPTLVTNGATAITNSQGQLNALANGGRTTITNIEFDIGTTTSYGTVITGSPGSAASATNTSVTATASDLVRGTTYHYRVRGEAEGDTIFGEDQTFMTPPGNLLRFDGINDYCTATAEPSYQFGDETDFTVEFWMQASSGWAGDPAIVSNKNWAAGLNSGWNIALSAGGTGIDVNVADGATRADLDAGIVNDNAWHHIAVTFDRDANVTLYVDGVVAQSASMAGIGNINTPYGIVMAQDGSLGYPFNYRGRLDELRLWNTLRTQTEIRDNMHLSLNGDEALLLAYWRMDTDNTIVSEAVSNNHGTLVNAVTLTESSVPLGYGTSDRQSVTASGTHTFGSTGVEMVFPNAGTYPNGELLVTRIEGASDATPNGTTSTSRGYWVVRNYGTNSTFTELTSLRLTNIGTVSAAAETTPASVKLFKRSSAATGATAWGSAHAVATAATQGADGEVTFGAGNNITSFSQVIVADNGITLPVELLNFTATVSEQFKVRLDWATATEINSSHFVVERSTNGSDFATVAKVPAQGASNSTQAYHALDQLPASGVYYYRLQQVDLDGTSRFSRVVPITLELSIGDGEAGLYPNPAQEWFVLELPVEISNPAQEVKLTNALGHPIAMECKLVGPQSVRCNIRQLDAGVYYVHWNRESIRLVVQ